MKFARISLSVTALVVTIMGAFAFKGHSSKFGLGTLYTQHGQEKLNCARVATGNACLVTAYTLHGTKVTGAKIVGE